MERDTDTSTLIFELMVHDRKQLASVIRAVRGMERSTGGRALTRVSGRVCKARKVLKAFVGVMLSMLLAGSVGHATTQPAGNEADAAALRASQAVIGHQTGDHEFIDQGGKPLRLADLRGRPVVLSLVFTNCFAVCSGQTLHLREVTRIARDALGARSFTVLTVGFDSAHDSPERMRAYGRDRGIDDPDWHFASADAATVRRLTDEVGFTWLPSARGFDHITQVTILDANGAVAQQVYGAAFAPLELVEPLKELLLGRRVDAPRCRGSSKE